MSAAYASTTDFTVAAGQNLQSTNQDALWLTQSSGVAPPDLSMQASSEFYAVADAAYTGAEIYAVRAFGDFTGATFTLAAQSQAYVQQQGSNPSNGAVAGYGIAATANLNLAGIVQVVVISGQATGILAPFTNGVGFPQLIFC